MIVTRGKVTCEQAARIATVAECIECGASATFLGHDPHTVIRHICGWGAIGPTWTVTERPSAVVRRHLAAS